jgi:hypothetical protein
MKPNFPKLRSGAAYPADVAADVRRLNSNSPPDTKTETESQSLVTSAATILPTALESLSDHQYARRMKLCKKLMQTLSLAFVLTTCELPDVCQCATQPGPIGASLWTAQGGAPIWDGDAGVANGEVAGAIQAVVQHPTNPNIMYVGTVNGGIWRTFNATATSPTWTPLTDFAPSLSISSLVLDPTDQSYNTLVAGLSSESSLGREGSTIHGLLRTTDGGNTWIYQDGSGLLADKDISCVIARSNVVLLSATESASGLVSTFGIYRSTNSGASFQQISTLTGQPNGLPYGRAHVLIGVPNNLSVLYTVLMARGGGTNGVYKSSDMGVTWTKVSNAAIDNLLPNCGDGVRMSATINSVVYIGISDSNNGGIVHVFRSADGGSTWMDLGLAQTSEASPTSVYISFVVMALFADPGNPNVVYVGGGDDLRCDISQTAGNQWARLNGCISASPPNSGNLNCTGPHTDSRNMTFDLSGDLILVCDGGIYRRTSPRNYLGSWSSIIGNLQVGEYHDVAYDPVFSVCISGSQDCGSQRQISPAQLLWVTIQGSDGGNVAVDSTSIPGSSIVYSSDEFFNLMRATYSSTLGVVTNITPSLTVIGGGSALQSQFITPMKLNSLNQKHLVIGANNIYESLDQANSITEIGPGKLVGRFGNGFAYGGSRGGVNNTDVLYAASTSGVLVRTNTGGILTNTPTPYPGGTPYDVAMLPTDWMTIYVVDASNVYMSTNAGGSWTKITGNLTGCGDFICVRAGPTNKPSSIVVGTHAGVYVSSSPNLGFWSMVGTNLPNAPVTSIEYNQTADVLLAGTLGRGAWLIPQASSTVFVASPPVIGTQPQSQTVLIDSAASFNVSVGGTPPFDYRWRKNGAPIAGATNTALLVSLVQPTDMGGYDVVVSNSFNTVTSLVASLTVTGSPPANCAMSAPAGLVSWWTGDGTAADRVGTNNGTLQNGVNYVLGEVRQAFNFDGVDGYVSVPDNPAWAFGTNDFTIELWADSSSSANNQALLAYDAGGGTLNKWIFWLNSNNLQLHINGPGIGANYITSSSFTRNNNQWYHIALTRQGTTFTYFLNGSSLSTVSSSLSIPVAAAPLTIGKAEGGFYFNGLLDEVRIYNRTLSAAEIQAIYLAGTNGMCPPTPLMFASPLSYGKNNGFVLSASLRSGQSYHFQANTNLASTNWISLTNFTAGTAPIFHLTNSAATNIPRQFYRIVSP